MPRPSSDGSQTDATFLPVMPADYNGGTITARFVWLIATGSTQTCRWQLEARGYADGQTLDQAWGLACAPRREARNSIRLPPAGERPGVIAAVEALIST